MSLSLHIEGTEEVPERYDQNHILKDIRVKEELRSVQSRLIISIIATFGYVRSYKVLYLGKKQSAIEADSSRHRTDSTPHRHRQNRMAKFVVRHRGYRLDGASVVAGPVE